MSLYIFKYQARLKTLSRILPERNKKIWSRKKKKRHSMLGIFSFEEDGVLWKTAEKKI